MNLPQLPLKEIYLCPGRQHENRSPVYVVWLNETRDKTIHVPVPSAIDNTVRGKGRLETIQTHPERSREVVNGDRCSFSNAYFCQECMAHRGYLFPSEREELIQTKNKTKRKQNQPNPQS